jgi:hypothetical protein
MMITKALKEIDACTISLSLKMEVKCPYEKLITINKFPGYHNPKATINFTADRTSHFV